VPISQGAIQRAVDLVSEAIKPHYGAIAQKARSSEVNYIDETAWYQHGVLAWLWVMVNVTVALFKVQASLIRRPSRRWSSAGLGFWSATGMAYTNTRCMAARRAWRILSAGRVVWQSDTILSWRIMGAG
jgi:Transposase IS66 family